MKGGRTVEAPMPVVLAHSAPFRMGDVEVRPPTREVVGPGGREVIEPRIMQVLVALHEAGGEIVSRDDLIGCCWDGRAVGDDAINRVVSKLRRVGETVAAGRFRIETITKVGYRLVEEAEPRGAIEPERPQKLKVERAGQPGISRRSLLGGGAAAAVLVGGGGWWAWSRLGPLTPSDLPSAARRDFEEGLRLVKVGRAFDATPVFQRVAEAQPEFAGAWAWVALSLELNRFAQTPESAELMEQRSRRSAARALELQPGNATALTAQAIALPVFGNWLGVETVLRDALEQEPDHLIARDFLARVMDAVGRTREAIELLEPYAEAYREMPGLQYRLATMLWSAGRLAESERTIERAMQLWGTDYPIWFSRFWLYVRAGRPEAALAMAARLRRPANIPAWNFDLNELNARAVLTRAPVDVQRAVAANREAAARGAGYAENAIILAAQLGSLDEAFALADAYYFGRGFQVAANRFAPSQGTFTPSYRRFTAFLFTPVMAGMRADARWGRLTEETGLASYWRRSGSRADAMA